MDDKMRQALEQAYRFEHGEDTLYAKAMDALQGNWHDKLAVMGVFVSSRDAFVAYLLFFIFFAIWAALWCQTKGSDYANVVKWRWMIATTAFIVAFVIDIALPEAIRPFFQHPHPAIALSSEALQWVIPVIGLQEVNVSFPSAHASFAALIIFSLWPLLYPALKLLSCLFLLGVCWSLTTLGLHTLPELATSVLYALVIVLVIRFVLQKIVPQPHEKRHANAH